MQLMSRLDRRATGASTYADRGLETLDGSSTDDLAPKAMARELRLSMALLATTMVAVVFFARDAVNGLAHRVGAGDLRGTIEQSVLLAVLRF